jgi:hypothetical protein
VDRYYIDRFVEHRGNDIRGCVLEVQEPRNTDRFGRGVVQSDVLDIRRENRRAAIYADLMAADEVPSDVFDCFILTQTPQCIYDLRRRSAHAPDAPGPVACYRSPCRR